MGSFQHPQLHFKIPHTPTNRDHKALNRGTLGGLASRTRSENRALLHQEAKRAGLLDHAIRIVDQVQVYCQYTAGNLWVLFVGVPMVKP